MACARRHGSRGRVPRARPHGQRGARQPQGRPLRGRQRAARARPSRARPSIAAPPSATSTTTAASTWWSPRSTAPLELWRNVSPAPHHWLLVEAVGTKSNRDGMGAKIKIVTASGAQHGHVNTAVGYGGASDRRVHFGLGARRRWSRELTITWPSGKTQTLKDVRRRPGPDRPRARLAALISASSLSWRKTSNCCCGQLRPAQLLVGLPELVADARVLRGQAGRRLEVLDRLRGRALREQDLAQQVARVGGVRLRLRGCRAAGGAPPPAAAAPRGRWRGSAATAGRRDAPRAPRAAPARPPPAGPAAGR